MRLSERPSQLSILNVVGTGRELMPEPDHRLASVPTLMWKLLFRSMLMGFGAWFLDGWTRYIGALHVGARV